MKAKDNKIGIKILETSALHQAIASPVSREILASCLQEKYY